jgi:hypothetical protein
MGEELKLMTSADLDSLLASIDQSVAKQDYEYEFQANMKRLIATIRAAWKERDDQAEYRSLAEDERDLERERVKKIQTQLAGQDGVVKHLQSELEKARAAPREVMPDYEVSLWDQLFAAALTGVVPQGCGGDEAQRAARIADAAMELRAKRREAGR